LSTGHTPSDYGDHATARREPEPPKAAGNGRRSPFARDRARVLHSAALRRLAGKTQVVGPGEGAEISGVPADAADPLARGRPDRARDRRGVGRGPDVVDTAGLAHDIGHPPFGHNGERALDEFGAACGGFEGNAQTLRILMRLEPKVDGTGLNLTRATLDAASKYPWLRRSGLRKFGAYADDAALLAWVRDGAPPGRCCLEAQIMDWADDVAYSVHDVEDGILAGRIDLATLAAPGERTALVALAARHFGAEPEALEAAAEALLALPVVDAVRGFDAPTAPAAAHIALKRLTSELVGRFAVAATDATCARSGPGPLRRYAADLVVPPAARAEVALLKAVALRYVMSDRRRPGDAGPPARDARRAGCGAAGRRPVSIGPGARAALARRRRRRRAPTGGRGPGRAADRPAGRRPPRRPRPPLSGYRGSGSVPSLGSGWPGHPASTPAIASCSACVTHSRYFAFTATCRAT
jgi:dGTPase